MSKFSSIDTSFFVQNLSLMHPGDTLLLVIDVQEKLMPSIHRSAQMIDNIYRLVEAAKMFSIPTIAMEQYPKGLGPTVAPILQSFAPHTPIFPKITFSACLCNDFLEQFSRLTQIHHVLITGAETHICILQTALDLLSMGKRVFISTDAVGAHSPRDQKLALRRIENSGGTLTTTEAILFEWCRTAEHPAFRSISRLVQEGRE